MHPAWSIFYKAYNAGLQKIPDDNGFNTGQDKVITRVQVYYYKYQGGPQGGVIGNRTAIT